MLIERFSAADIPAAARLACSVWGEELQGEAAELKNFIYTGMVRYYCRNCDYSARLVSGKKLEGFLLAALPSDEADTEAWDDRQLEAFSERERCLIREYRDYLSYNGLHVHANSGSGDLLLCLFVSRVPGGGNRLLQNAVQLAARGGLQGLSLWADETCDYDYYRRHGFIMREKFINDRMSLLGKQQTVIFHREIVNKSEHYRSLK